MPTPRLSSSIPRGSLPKCILEGFATLNRTHDGTYNITQRQPAVASSSPSLLLPPLPILASSSSTTSCGLTVMWTTFGVSVWNRHSVVR
jgi:hypothetical protein